ncbi:MAG: hypothetical protein JO250_14185 [Armatimonadetes bacterium]|nr:hypothetical protein [Armatimonadota bacterium]
MRPCLHCGQPVAPEKTVCPHCGTAMPTVWPPPPDAAPPSVPPVRLLTGRRGGDIALGIVVGVLSPVVWQFVSLLFPVHGDLLVLYGLFFFVALGGYLWARPRYPVFARSLGWIYMTGVALVLGAVALCFVALSTMYQHH